jgi:hypothetical protein
MRYLSETYAVGVAQTGSVIEQFLTPREESNYRVLRWVRVKKNRDGTYSVSRYEAFDEGHLDYLDLYAFSFVDPDSPCEESAGLPSINAAMKVAEEKFGADRRKYVNEGVIQDEYADFPGLKNGVSLVCMIDLHWSYTPDASFI